MPEVFISYRQTSDAERQRVRVFAERLRASGISVILDQFFLEANPGGPNDGWDKWSSDRAIHTRHVIIIGSESWFQCFDKTQPPGTGLGAACEADDIRHRVYEANGIVETIRVVLFDDADSKHISPKIKRYHRFHAERDFENILRWLGGTTSTTTASPSEIRHSSFGFRHSSLPTIQRFFGRDTELAKLLPDLHPDSTGWGALIDGPGGMGKTTLAIRAAELAAPGHYDDILFLSAKQTAMDPHGPHDESPFAVSGFTRDPGQKPMAEDAPGFERLARRDEGAYPQRSVTEEQRSQTLKDQADCAIGFRPGSPMLDAIARRLQKPEITQAPAEERPRLLIAALTGTRTLLVLDNLETLTDADQRSLFAFLGHLPRTCKALLTSRPLVIATGRRLKLQQLDQTAALQTLADIARDNPALAAAPESDRLRLITETGGNTLLLTWTAWQVGSGYCTTIADALAHLRSCPPGNDPLEFIFGDLLARFTPEEERIVATLSYPTDPIPVTAIAEISGTDEPTTHRALKLLTNRSIVVPQEGAEKYALVPMVAEFIRSARGEVVGQMGAQLADRAFRLIKENGYTKHERFDELAAAWPTIAPAIPLFIAGENHRLQTVCEALVNFLDGQGRWDEWSSLCTQAEAKALASNDGYGAGWRAYSIGYIHAKRNEPKSVFAAADRAMMHWIPYVMNGHERASAIRLLGLGHRLNKAYPEAIAAFTKSLALWRELMAKSVDVAILLNDIANAEHESGNLVAAELHYHEALNVARAVDSPNGIATYTGNLASLALDQDDWSGGEQLAREALAISQAVRNQLLIASNSHRLASALLNQDKALEALPHFQRAVSIYTHLNTPDLVTAQSTLAKCEATLSNKTC